MYIDLVQNEHLYTQLTINIRRARQNIEEYILFRTETKDELIKSIESGDQPPSEPNTNENPTENSESNESIIFSVCLSYSSSDSPKV